MIYIMKKYIILIIFIMILSPMHLANADKIQKNDTWQYDDQKKMINETAIDIIQIEAQRGDFLASVIVDTNRGFQYPYDLNISIQGDVYLYNLKFQLVPNDTGNLYLSQEGGLPLWINRVFSGIVTLTISNETFNFEKDFVINEIPNWKLEGTPSSAFATAETVAYAITSNFAIDDAENLSYKQWYIISTNEALSLKTRNYTVTQGDYILDGFAKDLSFIFVKNGDEFTWGVDFNGMSESGLITNYEGLSLSSLTEDALQLTWNEDEKLPTIITQTEPVQLVQGLELNQIDFERVTYILHDGASLGALSTKDDSPLIIFISSIVLIIFYRTYKKRRY